MKSKRQEKILELIADHSVQTQEQLLTELNEAGFSTTQATISRDIKQLRIIKELGPEGVYRYATAPKPAEHTFSAKLNLIFRQCITSVDYAQNMIVVKTMPGLANGAAAAIDKLNIPEMLGTLAGDDTCFVVLKDTQSAADLCTEIREQIEHGQFSCTWDKVVCGLCHVDVVIRVDNGIITLGAAQDFDGAVCDDFVCVHISTRSGAALDAVNDELVF